MSISFIVYSFLLNFLDVWSLEKEFVVRSLLACPWKQQKTYSVKESRFSAPQEGFDSDKNVL